MSQQESQPKSESASEQTLMIEWIIPEDGIHEAYSNFVHMNWALHDIRIRFGQIVPDPTKRPDLAQWVVHERAAITMAWGQAKFLRDILVQAIQKYEEKNGEITVPTVP